MSWTVTNLFIQVIMGLIGGHVAAVAAHEHSFGVVGHTITGLIGGMLSGYFLQTAVGTLLNGSGLANAPDPVSQAILQALAGLVAGAVVTLVVGLVEHSLEHHKAGTPDS
jgi:hypothetical protein